MLENRKKNKKNDENHLIAKLRFIFRKIFRIIIFYNRS